MNETEKIINDKDNTYFKNTSIINICMCDRSLNKANTLTIFNKLIAKMNKLHDMYFLKH